MEKEEELTDIDSEKEEALTIEEILRNSNQIFIYDEIDEKLAQRVNKQIIAYNLTSPDKPITIWINSPGGCVTDGLSIIDTMASRSNYIVTVVMGEVASMGSIISICGDYRVMTENAYWMQHGGIGGFYGNNKTAHDRLGWIDKLNKRVNNIMKKRTHLTKEDLENCEEGELWLDAKQAKKKGVIDAIMKVRIPSLSDINKIAKKKFKSKRIIKKTKKTNKKG